MKHRPAIAGLRERKRQRDRDGERQREREREREGGRATWHASQLSLYGIAAVAQLLADLVHHFEAACGKLIEHGKLALRWVGEHPVYHALVNAEGRLSVREVVSHVVKGRKAQPGLHSAHAVQVPTDTDVRAPIDAEAARSVVNLHGERR